MNTRTVLFVDDDQMVLNSLKRGLFEEPYNILFASSGQEALEILEQREVHVLVTDMRMPGMPGLELLRAARKKHNNVVRMVLSGYTHVSTLLTAINQGDIYKYIPKPWKLEEQFKPAILEAIEQYNLRAEKEDLSKVQEQETPDLKVHLKNAG